MATATVTGAQDRVEVTAAEGPRPLLWKASTFRRLHDNMSEGKFDRLAREGVIPIIWLGGTRYVPAEVWASRLAELPSRSAQEAPPAA